MEGWLWWISKQKKIVACAVVYIAMARPLAGPRGFEPRHIDSESTVLPLDEGPTEMREAILWKNRFAHKTISNYPASC